MFMMLPPWLSHARVHPVYAMNAEQRQVAADPWTKPTDLSHKSASICTQHINYTDIHIITLPER